MARYCLGEIFFVLALLKVSYAAIKMDTLDKRLCQSHYVFKFRVTSSVKIGCFPKPTIKKKRTRNLFRIPTKPRPRPTLESAEMPSATSPVEASPSSVIQPTSSRNGRAFTTPSANYSRIKPTSTQSSTGSLFNNLTTPSNGNTPTRRDQQQIIQSSTPSNSNFVSTEASVKPHTTFHNATTTTVTAQAKRQTRALRGPVQRPSKKCMKAAYQTVRILKQDVYKGAIALEIMDAIKVFPKEDYYEGILRPGLFYRNLLKLNKEYLYVAKQIPNLYVKDNVLVSNIYTVETWTTALESKTKRVDFKQTCTIAGCCFYNDGKKHRAGKK